MVEQNAIFEAWNTLVTRVQDGNSRRLIRDRNGSLPYDTAPRLGWLFDLELMRQDGVLYVWLYRNGNFEDAAQSTLRVIWSTNRLVLRKWGIGSAARYQMLSSDEALIEARLMGLY